MIKILSGKEAAGRHALGLIASSAVSHGIDVKPGEWFGWKYAHSPFGESIWVMSIKNEEKVAGALAFGRYHLTWGVEDVEAALSYETFVHPEFRGQGLFSRLLEVAMEEMERREIEVVFNFPNSQSLRGFQKAGWVTLPPVPTLLKVVRPYRVARHVNGSLRKGRFLPEPAEMGARTALPEEENWPPSVRRPGLLAPLRTRPYLEWRLNGEAGIGYRVYEFGETSAVVRRGRRGALVEVQIMDLMSEGEPSRRVLRTLIRELSATLTPDLITFNCSPTHPWYAILRRSGFWVVPNHINSTVLPLSPRFQACTTPEHWLFTTMEFHTY